MKMSKIIVGGMRFANRAAAVETVRCAIDCGFNYIDTSPAYSWTDETENSEAWIGEALAHADYRDRVMVSTKCAPGDGARGLGKFVPEKGFGVGSVEQLQQVMNQSLRRLRLDSIDWYHLWTTHTREQFAEAMKPGGWYDGVRAMSDKWTHLGVTTHADPDTILHFLESGIFEAVTIPLNVVNTTRLGMLDYCRDKSIKVIAMNPLAGGFLAVDERLRELSLRYLMALEKVHVLVGFSSPEHVKYAKWIEETTPECDKTAEDIRAEVDGMIDTEEPRCTACGYCQPCPQNINVGAALSYYNVYKYMNIPQAKKDFLDKQWENGLQLDKCTACGTCEKRCPNSLPVCDIIADARKLMYDSEDD